MDLKKYFESSYSLLKSMFEKTADVENTVLVGTVREYIASRLFSFFPECPESGWIMDQNGEFTGQIDLLSVRSNALCLPALLVGDTPVRGFFATQVCAAFEIKSWISKDISSLMNKTWQCHRLQRGRFYGVGQLAPGVPFTYSTEGVPVVVVGANGFGDATKYSDHFEGFGASDYKVNGEAIEPPTSESQVVPELLLDFSHNTLLVSKPLVPEVVVEHPAIGEQRAQRLGQFTAITGLDSGEGLLLLIYYLSLLRASSFIGQGGEGAPLLDAFCGNTSSEQSDDPSDPRRTRNHPR